MPEPAISRLSFCPEAHYAVAPEAWWKKAVWRTASEPPRPATPRPCVMPSGRRWRIPTIRVGERATPAPPVAATSWSSNATIAPRTTGRWPASSSATCAWTTTSPFATWGPRVMRHKRAWCATCSIRHSTRFGPSRRRSRSAATRRAGSRSFAASPASIWKARSTVARITGPSGAGIALALARTSGGASKPPRNRRAHHGHCARLVPRLQSAAMARSAARGQRHLPAERQPAARGPVALRDEVPAQEVRTLLLRAVRGRAGAAVRIVQAVHPGQPIQAEALTRASQRGGS